MPKSYDRIAGQSIERLAALSDGIFAVAMTLLILDVSVPDRAAAGSEKALFHARAQLSPQVLVYLMSFLTLGIFWVGQQTQLNSMARSDRHLTWIHLALLFPVTILPFSTRLLTEFIEYRIALIAYWLNILTLGSVLYTSWSYATRAGLVDDAVPIEVRAAICRRIIVAQLRYAIGILLCVLSTFVSIGFIVLVQLNYAVAPRYWRRKQHST